MPEGNESQYMLCTTPRCSNNHHIDSRARLIMVYGQDEGVCDNGRGECREGLWSRPDMGVVRFAPVVVLEGDIADGLEHVVVPGVVEVGTRL
jgi:hypothetical protein